MEEPLSTVERLKNELKASGENEWKKRIPPKKQQQQKQNEVINIGCKSDISSKQDSLRSSLSEGWKVRVPVLDTHRFTVTGKISRDGLELTTPPPPPPPNDDTQQKKNKKIIKDFDALKLDNNYLLNKELFKKPRKHFKNLPSNEKATTLAASALAGLASTEDFTSIVLRTTNEELLQNSDSSENKTFLYLIKGRRMVQPRLIAPDLTNLTLGDSFILLHHQNVYLLQGTYSNLLERSKSDEIFKKCSDHLDKKIVNHENEASWAEFTKHLQHEEEEDEEINLNRNLGDEHDQDYENSTFTQIYQVKANTLNHIAHVTLFQILHHNQVLVFDYMTEVYVWCGSRSSAEDKTAGEELGRNLTIGRSLCLFRKINQFMEPIFFSAKFFDWPMQYKNWGQHTLFFDDNEEQKTLDEVNLDSVELEEEPDLILEGFNIGLVIGDVQQVSDEDRRLRSIVTVSLEKWTVEDDGRIEKTSEHLEEFCTEGVYILRWVYNVSYLSRDLKGRVSSVPVSKGRDRICWFFWYGRGVEGVLQRAAVGAVFSGISKGAGLFTDLQGVKMAIEEGAEPGIFGTLFSPLTMTIRRKACAGVEPDAFIKLKGRYWLQIPYRRDLLRSNHPFKFYIQNEWFYFNGEDEGLILLPDNLREEYFDDRVFNDYILKVFSFTEERAGILTVSRLQHFTQIDLEITKDQKILFIEGNLHSFFLWPAFETSRWNGLRKAALKSVHTYVKNNGKRNLILGSCHGNQSFAHLFPYWEGPMDQDQELTTIEDEFAMVQEFDNAKHSVQHITNNSYYVQHYLDFNRIIHIVTDQDLISFIDMDFRQFSTLPHWKQNLIRKDFIKNVFQ